MAGVHMALVMPNCAITEFNFTEHPLNEFLLAEPVKIVDGHVAAPTAPGARAEILIPAIGEAISL